MKCTYGKETPLGIVGEHDWVLVPRPPSAYMDDAPENLLWACPCGEFKWTSYADWEKGRKIAEPAKHPIVTHEELPEERRARELEARR